jgi:tetratricopeptide (TPR) repeat protein/energy-coupling factor transporter ATP-binding protein EcfA2
LESGSLLVIYFGGHGRRAPDGQLELGLSSSDETPNKIEWMSVDTILGCVETSPLLHVVIFLDCCHAGAVANNVPTGWTLKDFEAFGLRSGKNLYVPRDEEWLSRDDPSLEWDTTKFGVLVAACAANGVVADTATANGSFLCDAIVKSMASSTREDRLVTVASLLPLCKGSRPLFFHVQGAESFKLVPVVLGRIPKPVQPAEPAPPPRPAAHPSSSSGGVSVVKLLDWSKNRKMHLTEQDWSHVEVCDKLSCVSIVGESGTGKSTFLNALLHLCSRDGAPYFETSNRQTSGTTVGIDMLSKPITVPTEIFPFAGSPQLVVLDVEGTGDDSTVNRILIPPMLLSHVVIYNYKGRVRREPILSTLAVLTDAAEAVTGKPDHLFGHLVFLLRDWDPKNDIYEAEKSVLEDEIIDGSQDKVFKANAADRNARRKKIRDSFRSISFFSLPKPFAPSEDDSKDFIPPENMPTGFLERVKQLLQDVSISCTGETVMDEAGNKLPLSGKMLVNMLNKVVEDFDAKEYFDLPSMWLQAQRTRAQAVTDKAVGSLRQQLNELKLPKATAALAVEMDNLVRGAMAAFLAEITSFSELVRTDFNVHFDKMTTIEVAATRGRNEAAVKTELELFCEKTMSTMIRSELMTGTRTLHELQRFFREDLVAHWPDFADPVLQDECIKRGWTQLQDEYKVPDYFQLLTELKRAVKLWNQNRRGEARYVLMSWAPLIERWRPVGQLVSFAEEARNIDSFTAGYWLSMVWDLDQAAFPKDPALAIDAARYYTQGKQFGKARPLYEKAVEWERVSLHDLSGGLFSLGRFEKKCAKYSGTSFEMAVKVLKEAIDTRPVQILAYGSYLSAVRRLHGAAAAETEKVQLLPTMWTQASASKEDYTVGITQMWKKNLVSDEEALHLLAQVAVQGVQEDSVVAAFIFRHYMLRRSHERAAAYVEKVTAALETYSTHLRTACCLDLGAFWDTRKEGETTEEITRGIELAEKYLKRACDEDPGPATIQKLYIFYKNKLRYAEADAVTKQYAQW